MEFALSDEQQMIAETARAFFAENATSERTRRAMAIDGIDPDLWQGFCRELGLSGIGIAEAAGGAGLGLIELALVAESAGANVAALPLLGSIVLAAQAIAAGGTAEQHARYLPDLLSGDVIGAYVHDHELSEHPDNVRRFVAMVELLGQQAQAVPTLVYCRQMEVGLDSSREGLAGFFSRLEECRWRKGESAEHRLSMPPLAIPLLGEIDSARLSLPLLTSVMRRGA